MKNETIPNKMLAARQHEKNGILHVDTIDVPTPGPGEVLVRMEAAPINPSDLSMLQGTYNTKPNYPFVPGLEGCGVVVAVGSGLLPRLRLNQRVACSPMPGGHGTWAQYIVTKATRCIPLKKHVSQEQGATLLVNPMTALALMDVAKQGKHQAVVNNAAGSALGKMLIRLAIRFEIPLINVVRRNEQVQELQQFGGRYVLNSSLPNFDQTLKDLAHELNATLFLDAVGGAATSSFIQASPKGSAILLYANLSEEPFQVEPRRILQENKTITGFSLGNYTAQKSIFQLLSLTRQVQKYVGNELKTQVAANYSLAEINQALEQYKSHMSQGKVLIRMQARE
jgi:NADPH:quinone reductase